MVDTKGDFFGGGERVSWPCRLPLFHPSESTWSIYPARCVFSKSLVRPETFRRKSFLLLDLRKSHPWYQYQPKDSPALGSALAVMSFKLERNKTMLPENYLVVATVIGLILRWASAVPAVPLPTASELWPSPCPSHVQCCAGIQHRHAARHTSLRGLLPRPPPS